MQTATNAPLECLAKSGLRANPAKCAIRSMVADGRNKRVLVDERPCLNIEDAKVSGMKPTQTCKYLGISVKGKVQTPEACVREMLSNLQKDPLKPQQRIFIVKHHLIRRIYHKLILQRVTAKLMLTLDKTVRGELWAALRLPKDTPLVFVYAHPADG